MKLIVDTGAGRGVRHPPARDCDERCSNNCWSNERRSFCNWRMSLLPFARQCRSFIDSSQVRNSNRVRRWALAQQQQLVPLISIDSRSISDWQWTKINGWFPAASHFSHWFVRRILIGRSATREKERENSPSLLFQLSSDQRLRRSTRSHLSALNEEDPLLEPPVPLDEKNCRLIIFDKRREEGEDHLSSENAISAC